MLWFGLFEHGLDFEFADTETEPFQLEPWRPLISREEYGRAFVRIKEYLERGDTYQVDFTLRLESLLRGSPLALFRFLWAGQRAAYSAYVETDDFALCSASPELFFSLDGERLVSKPMKGTAGRGLTVEEDEVKAAELAGSAKNRAENVMIVDMIRNDMGRIAEPGSVEVSDLYAVEKYPTVFQMVSTVSCRTASSFVDIIKALFPCASITGAPKVRTMELIRELEAGPRGVYTGCIGLLKPGRKALFNVAIRTVAVDKTTGVAGYGVGGGIVWDSECAMEYDECLLKAAILTARPLDFELLETLLWERGEFFLLDRHLARMQKSASYFDYAFDRNEVEDRLRRESALFGPGMFRVRARLGRTGELQVTAQAFSVDFGKPWRVGLAAKPVDRGDVFLYHKTTNRSVYDDARKSVEGFDDVLLFNENGELTESTIANVVAELDGRRLTPPVECGLLAGVFRGWLLDHHEIEEAVLTRADLTRAQNVYLVNSVRKWVPVEINENSRARRSLFGGSGGPAQP